MAVGASGRCFVSSLDKSFFSRADYSHAGQTAQVEAGDVDSAVAAFERELALSARAALRSSPFRPVYERSASSAHYGLGGSLTRVTAGRGQAQR